MNKFLGFLKKISLFPYFVVVVSIPIISLHLLHSYFVNPLNETNDIAITEIKKSSKIKLGNMNVRLSFEESNFKNQKK